MSLDLEKILVKHCGPVLMKKKPAALAALPCANRGEILDFSSKYLQAALLKQRAKNDLILFYQEQMLWIILQQAPVRRILLPLGYPLDQSLTAIIAHLQLRMEQMTEFPHEVGLFLGYPVADVEGFIRHRGANYKYCCGWKVYGSVSLAKKLCAEYHQCRNYLLDYVEKGGRLYQICGEMAGN